MSNDRRYFRHVVSLFFSVLVAASGSSGFRFCRLSCRGRRNIGLALRFRCRRLRSFFLLFLGRLFRFIGLLRYRYGQQTEHQDNRRQDRTHAFSSIKLQFSRMSVKRVEL